MLTLLPVELLECILEQLDVSTFFTTPLVCRSWHALHTQMLTSNTLMRKKLFLIPARLEEVLEPLIPGKVDYNIYLQHGRRVRVGKNKLEQTAVMLNPFLHKAVEGYNWGGDLLQEIVDAKDIRSNMILTQPPLEHIIWPTTFGPKEAEGNGQYGVRGQGSYIWLKLNGSVHAKTPGVRGLADLMDDVVFKVRQIWGCSVYWKASGIRLEGEKIDRRRLDDVLGGVDLNEQVWRVLEGLVQDDVEADTEVDRITL
ncbi:hypothetical protein LTR17_022846 [Elasticomyces elasticus]|nr:hypothetical protein LTR17_022846 [Elasticomyces elasticus]